MALEVKAPNSYPDKGYKIFLAGSIDMGKAEDWQSSLASALSHLDVIFLNPRRDDWDSSWRQSMDDPAFAEQVTWEMDALEGADMIVMYLSEESQAPISLLELGLHARSKKIMVACHPKFWRRGNVEAVCMRFDIPLMENQEQLVESVVKSLKS